MYYKTYTIEAVPFKFDICLYNKFKLVLGRRYLETYKL